MKKSSMPKLLCAVLMAVCLFGVTAMADEDTASASSEQTESVSDTAAVSDTEDTEDSSDEETSDPVSLSGASITLAYTSCTYDGTAKEPAVTVTVGSTTLTSGTDYTVSYSNNTDAGTATVTVEGDGTNYINTASATFTISQKSVSSATVTLNKSSFTYNKNTQKPSVTSVKLTLNGSTVTLTSGTDYTITNNGRKSVGSGTVKITGTGNYTGTVSKTYKINPKSATDISFSAASKGIRAEWTRVSAQATGYQIQCATNKTFTSGKHTVTVTGRTTEVGGISGLTGKKTYYVRMRTYKTVDGTKYYSSWSTIKKVTTKKKITVFAGDSIMTGMSSSSYNGIKYVDISGTEKVVAKKSLTSYSFQTTTVGSSDDTYLDRVISYQPYRLYIMLGTNGIAYQSVSYTIENYEELIECIQEESPTTDIVILAVPPVSKSVAAKRTGFKKINTLNKKLKAMAKEYGVHYYNYTSVFKTSSGYLKSTYNGGDGIHWNLKGYKKFAALISKYDAKLED